MSRDWKNFLHDMQDFCERISSYTAGMDRKSFEKSQITFDAVVRNIELIGEAASRIPKEQQQTMPDIQWRELVAVRNILAHGYFGINMDILWDIIANKVPELNTSLKDHLENN